MAYQGKTDWSYDDIVTEQDMNRIERGLQEVSEQTDSVEQAVIDHLSDNERHITQAERDEWNAKETPAGAQEKADSVQGELNWHRNSTIVHGATSEASADRIALRDSNGRLKIANGSDGQDAINLSQLTAHADNNTIHITAAERADWNAKETPAGAQAKADAVQASLNSHSNNTSNPHNVTSQQITEIPYRAATVSGNEHPIGVTTFAVPSGSGTGIEDGYPVSLINALNFKIDNSRLSQMVYNAGSGTARSWIRHWRSDTGWSDFNEVVTSSGGTISGNLSIGNATSGTHALNRNTADDRYARTGAMNTFSNSQTFEQNIYARGNFPLHFLGTTADTPNKRNYRWDVAGDELRLQALDDNLAYTGPILNMKHDGSNFNFNGRVVWHAGNNTRGSASSGGYQRLANGLILQWGARTAVSPHVRTSVTFPIAFSSSPQMISATVDSDTPSTASIAAGTATQFYLIHNDPVSRQILWFAIGL
ncbi:gp53-like domain-containing protein [Paenibacillus senegalensis]|uniref:gp53-like domain-containing protein n=1 Tax=Paenibacillus senegalensis TaxID=1465766 RepID=UPI000288EC6A|nr:hypothetical protein [Paenibacillus senegalensis]